MRSISNLVAGLALIGLSDGIALANSDDILADFDASRFERLAVNVAVGTLTVTAADTETIQVRIRLKLDDGWFSGSKGDLQDVQLESAESSSTLRLVLDRPSDIDDDDLEEHWEVTIPRDLETRLRIGVGTIEVTGTTADVEAHAGVGEVNVDVESGAVRAHASVGDVRVTSRTLSAGDIEVDADVGNARLRVNGKKIGARRGWGPGSQVRLDGDGDDRFEISSDVGNASLVIEGG